MQPEEGKTGWVNLLAPNLYREPLRTRAVPLAKRRESDSTVAMIRAGFLEPELRRDLIELARDGSAAHRLARRSNALVLLDQGMSCGDVAQVLFLDDDTVWLGRTAAWAGHGSQAEGVPRCGACGTPGEVLGAEGRAHRRAAEQRPPAAEHLRRNRSQDRQDPNNRGGHGERDRHDYAEGGPDYVSWQTSAGLADEAGVPDPAAFHPHLLPAPGSDRAAVEFDAQARHTQ
jgi:hypothetical protein